jgi:hypothetical protein
MERIQTMSQKASIIWPLVFKFALKLYSKSISSLIYSKSCFIDISRRTRHRTRQQESKLCKQRGKTSDLGVCWCFVVQVCLANLAFISDSEIPPCNWMLLVGWRKSVFTIGSRL